MNQSGRINCFGDIAGNIGYAVHARNFFRALNRQIPVCVIPKYNRLPADLQNDDEIFAMLERLEHINLNVPAINLDYPGTDMLAFGGSARIGYTVFESNILPQISRRILSQLDQVWVPTQWAKDVLAENAVPESRVRVVPEGIDPTIFRPSEEVFPDIVKMGGMRFVSVGKWEERKGVKELLRAFDEAFDKKDQAYLFVYFMSEVKALQGIDVGAEIKKLDLKNQDKIVVIQSPLPTVHDMARLYNSCHVYVSATRAEGWGLPLSEALGCGLPVIAPFYSGPTEFLTEEIAYPYAVNKLEDVYCPIFFPHKGQHGQWASIDRDLLIARLREVYQNPAQAAIKGEAAAKTMRQKWTWDHAAKTALSHLQPYL